MQHYRESATVENQASPKWEQVPPIHTTNRWSRLTALSEYVWQLLALWLMLRILTSLWAALVSPLHPHTLREQAIPLWPPSEPLGAWLERVLLAPWERWDTHSYLTIIRQGYQAGNGTAQFHPLFAWIATPLAGLTGSPLLGLMLISSGASLGVLITFERLARLDLDQDAAHTSTLLLAFSPLAFILFAPYTEALWLFWAVLCLFWARRQAWWLAGLAGALATLTRQQGLFLALPLAWELWEASGRNWRQAVGSWRNCLAVGLIPAGLLVWLVYRAVALNDLQANFSDPQALIYSLLISPDSSKIVPNQAFLWPWEAFYLALAKLWREPEYSLVIDLVLGIGFLALSILAWRNLRTSYRLLAITIILVSFGYHTGPHYPYMGLPRHLLLAFPVFIGLGQVMQQRWLRLTMAFLGLMGMLFLLLQYVIQGWVP
jgi:hypothetical protein